MTEEAARYESSFVCDLEVNRQMTLFQSFPVSQVDGQYRPYGCSLRIFEVVNFICCPVKPTFRIEFT